MNIGIEHYRPCVAMLIIKKGRVLLLERSNHPDNWQVPQGGVEERESPHDALWRELKEETGITSSSVEIASVTKDYLYYQIPCSYRHPKQKYIGQKQVWFLLNMHGSERSIRLNQSNNPEFTRWEWVSYWNVLACIVPFKKEVYRQALVEFLPTALQMGI